MRWPWWHRRRRRGRWSKSAHYGHLSKRDVFNCDITIVGIVVHVLERKPRRLHCDCSIPPAVALVATHLPDGRSRSIKDSQSTRVGTVYHRS